MWFRTLFDSLKPRSSRVVARQARRDEARQRPVACRLGVEALGDRIVPSTLSVGDTAIVEGNAGTQYAEVRVSLDAPTNKTVTVNYGTANVTALAGSDYVAASGTLTFAPGETGNTVRVAVKGDRLGEGNETFSVKLQAAKNAHVADRQGVVTIVDDEPRVSISDVSASEGNCGCNGGTPLTFTVSLSAAYDQVVTVNYSTADGSATTADNDYVAAFGTLTFAPGETTKTVTVMVLGDTTPEGAEAFFVNLSGASANVFVARGQGYGWIQDDDGWIPEPPPVDSGLPAIPTEGYYDPSNPYGIAP